MRTLVGILRINTNFTEIGEIGLLKVLAGIDTNFTVTSKASDEDGDFAELYRNRYPALSTYCSNTGLIPNRFAY